MEPRTGLSFFLPPAGLRHRADVISADGQSLFRVLLVHLQGSLAAILQRASAPASVTRWADPVLRCILRLLLAVEVVQARQKVVVDAHEEEAARGRPSGSDIEARAEKEKDAKAPFSEALMHSWKSEPASKCEVCGTWMEVR